MNTYSIRYLNIDKGGSRWETITSEDMCCAKADAAYGRRPGEVVDTVTLLAVSRRIDI